MKDIVQELTKAFNDKILRMKNNKRISVKDLSDGYHTFGELYYHRMMLFSVICNQNKSKAWKSWKHDDGTMFENMFIVGVETEEGQYTYHYDAKDWNNFDVVELKKAPKYDGHIPSDITRLLFLHKEEEEKNRLAEMGKALEKAHKTDGIEVMYNKIDGLYLMIDIGMAYQSKGVVEWFRESQQEE